VPDLDPSDPAVVAAEALVTAIVPVVGSRVVRLATGQPLPPDGADVWLLRPDPNHRSTADLLESVEGVAGGRGVMLLHSVGWPTATRDCYPDPARLPADAVHPHTAIDPAVRAEARGADAVGRPTAGGPAWAIRDGGPGNGVATALDDYLARHPDRCARRMPVGSGLAVVWPDGDAAVRAVVDDRATWCGDDVLEAVDVQRRALMVRIAELEAQLVAAGDAGPRLRDENARLRSAVNDQGVALDEIARTAEELGYSSVLRAVDAAERVGRRRRPGASFRQRIEAIRARAVDARRHG